MIQKVLDIQQATERGGANADGGVLQTSLAVPNNTHPSMHAHNL